MKGRQGGYRGKRRGRCKPAPYTKYNKHPYRYSAAYYDWRRGVVGAAMTAEAKAAERKAREREQRDNRRAV